MTSINPNPFFISFRPVHSLAQRTNQETSTLTKASPYMERMQHEKLQRPSTFLGFSNAGHALCFLLYLLKGPKLAFGGRGKGGV